MPDTIPIELLPNSYQKRTHDLLRADGEPSLAKIARAVPAGFVRSLRAIDSALGTKKSNDTEEGVNS